jgi:predicted RNase H-like nuclease (RuvC/YqgF family)
VTAKKAPDVLGDANRVQMLYSALATAQAQRFELSLRQVQEGAADSDSSGHVDPRSGAAVSYADRLKQLDDGISRLVEENSDLMPQVEEMARARSSVT